MCDLLGPCRKGYVLHQEWVSKSDVDESGLLPEEARVMKALCDATNAYTALPVQHPSEQRDFTDAIHICQQLLALRIARRGFPEGWPIKE